MNPQPETTTFELTAEQVKFLRELIEVEIDEIAYRSRFSIVYFEEKMAKELLLLFTKP